MSRKLHRRALASIAVAASFVIFLPGAARADTPTLATSAAPAAVAAVESGKAATVAAYLGAVRDAQMTAWYTAVAVGGWAAAHQPVIVRSVPGTRYSVPSTGGGGCAYDAQIRAAFGSAGDWAVGIARRESGCDPGAYNRSGASGLFQLLGHQDLVNAVCPGGSVFDPACNIAAAKKLYDGSGAAPWRL